MKTKSCFNMYAGDTQILVVFMFRNDKKMFTFLLCIPLILILMVKIKVFMKHHTGPLR